MPPLHPAGPEDDARQSPVYWFVLMEQARQRYDFAAALRAKQELERLGVCVTYSRPSSRRGGGPHHAA